MADWVGRAAWYLRPLRDHILERLRRSERLFADETTASVLDPGRGRTKTGQLWAFGRDDRPWGGGNPPMVAYVYAADRKHVLSCAEGAERAEAHLGDFAGILQVDGWRLCRARPTPTADQARLLLGAIRYALTRWDGLSRFLNDGRIDLDSNTVERSIRPLALNRKNALFAGSDEGGDNWAVIATLIECCKLNAINPHEWLIQTLARLAKSHPANRVGELMPWTAMG